MNARCSPRYLTWMRGKPSGPLVTAKGSDWRSRWTSGSENWRPRRRFTCDIEFLGFMRVEAEPAVPMKRCFSPKLTTAGVSRLDSSLRTTSMPRWRATATMQLSFPKSRPTTLIFLLVEVEIWLGRDCSDYFEILMQQKSS